MQTAQLVEQSSDEASLTSWFEPEHTFAQHLDATINLLCQMSRYHCSAYCYRLNNKHYLKITVPEHRIIEIEVDAMQYPDSCYNVSPDTSEFLQFKHLLQQQGLDEIQSFSILILSSKELNQQLPIFLFSMQDKDISLSTWVCLQQYLEQRAAYLDQLVVQHRLQQRLKELEEINSGRTKYFSVIAHDLRAPFHGILGCADILAHERDTLDNDAAQRLADCSGAKTAD